MDIIAITVSVNYSDILKHMIDQNSKFFKVWYIVTSPEDKETVRLIEEKNIPQDIKFKTIVLNFISEVVPSNLI